MKIIIQNIKMPVGHTEQQVIAAAQEIVRSASVSAKNFCIYKQSIDARRKHNIHFIYSVLAECPDGTQPDDEKIQTFQEIQSLEIPQRDLRHRPVVVGMGPCGLFAAYVLAQSGNPPLLVERGENVDKRTEDVERFWKNGILKPNSNVQFGEGGAGTFSDGKLNTRISDPRQRFILHSFVKFGAPRDILYRANPHIGTDLLKNVIKNMRQALIEMGVEIRFQTELTDLQITDKKISGIVLNDSESVPCSALILAIGHSSRDTYQMLAERNVFLQPKAFAAGVRIEHKRTYVDAMQYGQENLGLPTANYRLVYNGKERSCYSFCMCPGGTIVNASSEEGRLVINGMSEHARMAENSNSALVVNVRPEDYGNTPLGGIEFQRKYEHLAFVLGGEDYAAPVQLARDFLKDQPSAAFGSVSPSFTGKVKFAELKNCLPPFITAALRDGLMNFERKMKGFALGDGILTGVEMRTSAPLCITRDKNLQSVGLAGLYPAGEGAGYAGGIMSASLDGIRTALAVLDR